ncbi:MAG: aldo/keto reductase [Ferruginibacter sp.]|nr:aldo/keto reductase [Ferruginibacter sp.]
MQYKSIPNTNLQVSPINLGCNVFGWTADKNTSYKILDTFLDAGFNFIDTSDTYPWWVNGVGELSEEIIGSWIKLRNNRDKLVIATKTGSKNKYHPEDISSKHIFKAIDDSLSRLQTDYVDLYYTHFDDKVTPVSDTMCAFEKIIKAGKVNYIAASNISSERFIASMDFALSNNMPAYIALQTEYNLMERTTFETIYHALIKKYQLAYFPFRGLASGFLTGKYLNESDLNKSVRGSGLKKYLNERGMQTIAAIQKIAKKHRVIPAAISIAWILAQPDITAPIVSEKTKEQLLPLLESTKVILDDEDLELLNNIH